MARAGYRSRSWLTACAALLALAACRGEPGDPSTETEPARPDARGTLSPDAHPEIVEMLREGLAAPRHPSDGGGRAWLEQAEGDTNPATARSPGRFHLVFEVGPEGIASGGSIHLQVSPFWGWSTPQVEIPELPGYTTVEPSAPDIELEIETLDQQLLGMRVSGRALRPGEQLRLVYGAGPAGAIADEMAERNSRFWFAVDGDGDGVRAFLEDSPGIDVVAGPPAQLVVTLPSVARPGETIRLSLSVLDALGSAGFPFEGEVLLSGAPTEWELPERIVFDGSEGGTRNIEVIAAGSGTVRLRATTADGLSTVSNPILVSADGPRVFWGDLHGHSSLSDGTGTAEDYFRYARDVAALDVVALTDHDHWGILPLDSHPEMWEEITSQVRRFHEPGRFVTLLGFEWTNWLHGHRHVLYFEDEGVVYSSLSEQYESPTQLWDALRGKPVLTFAHHSAGGPIATNWTIPPDPVLEPLTEIVSVHGSSEAADAPNLIYDPQPGNFVRDALDRGYRFGFVGSGDSHDGHPGLAHLGAAAWGGLAAILSDELTRESVLEALRERRVYATNGPRILLRAALGTHRMGARIPTPTSDREPESFFVQVLAVTPLERVDLIRSGEVVASMPIDGLLEVTLQHPIEDLASGEYLYVRAVQQDGGAAWSSPIFVE